ncbi:hypothetical protein V1514DRAFT_275889 [Lipomyces japonicus]|uniref:uncharacterized protein n=1 Tax=Lipomyces japonicus TaxID=56871 RepID=UPI0034CFD9A0
MARLAEQVPAETVDSVKRRFMRQNRELAKVNSSHSARIGNLEAKITSLLAENLELRQQVIALEHSRAPWISKICRDMKEQLHLKFKEFEQTIDYFENSAVKTTHDERRRSSAGNFDFPDMFHVSTRKKSSPKVFTDEEDIEDPVEFSEDIKHSEQESMISSYSPRKEHTRFTQTVGLLANGIPESPPTHNGESLGSEIASSMKTVKSQRRRRDSLQDMDIISIIKSQNSNYKAKQKPNAITPLLELKQSLAQMQACSPQIALIENEGSLLMDIESPETMPEIPAKKTRRQSSMAFEKTVEDIKKDVEIRPKMTTRKSSLMAAHIESEPLNDKSAKTDMPARKALQNSKFRK